MVQEVADQAAELQKTYGNVSAATVGTIQRQLLVLDNASWHKAGRLHWHHFEPVYLPGYSPDFNPIERLWLRLKADWFWDFIAHTEKELTARLCTALKSFVADPSKTASICAIRK